MIFVGLLMYAGRSFSFPTMSTYTSGFTCTLIQAVIAAGSHLFPSRTEKLSPLAPMVLHTRGRVGSRHFLQESPELSNEPGAFLVMENGQCSMVNGQLTMEIVEHFFCFSFACVI